VKVDRIDGSISPIILIDMTWNINGIRNPFGYKPWRRDPQISIIWTPQNARRRRIPIVALFHMTVLEAVIQISAAAVCVTPPSTNY
jgi:hypothetical protein